MEAATAWKYKYTQSNLRTARQPYGEWHNRNVTSTKTTIRFDHYFINHNNVYARARALTRSHPSLYCSAVSLKFMHNDVYCIAAAAVEAVVVVSVVVSHYIVIAPVRLR